MMALDGLLAAYEAEHGEITEREMESATRRAGAPAVVARTPVGRPKPG